MTTTRLPVAAAATGIAVSAYRRRRGADGMRIQRPGAVLRRRSSGSTRRQTWRASIYKAARICRALNDSKAGERQLLKRAQAASGLLLLRVGRHPRQVVSRRLHIASWQCRRLLIVYGRRRLELVPRRVRVSSLSSSSSSL